MAPDSPFRRSPGQNPLGRKEKYGADSANDAAPPEAKKRGFFTDLLLRFVFFQIQIVKILLVAVFVFVLAGWGGYYLIQHQLKKAEILVPNIAGLRLEKAVQILHAKELDLSLKIEKMEYSDLVEEGEIISQFPRAGTFVKSGAVVRVNVSEGTTRVSCPDVRGKNDFQAGIDLRKVDLNEGGKTFLPDPDLKRNLVIAQDPPPGTLLDRGAKVHLLVSLGPKPTRILMPRLVDLTLVEAQELLAPLGLRISTFREEPFPEKDDGIIWRQDPPSGATVAPDAAIGVTLVWNIGANPEPQDLSSRAPKG